MNKFLKILFFIFLTLNKFHAQNLDSTQIESSRELMQDSIQNKIDSIKENSSAFEFGIDYVNKLNFWGRTFGVNQFGSSPYIMYKHKSGVYAYFAENYWSGMDQKFAKSEIGIGFQKQYSDKFYYSFGYERWTFSNLSKGTKAPLSNYLELILNYETKLLTLEPSFYAMFGTHHFYQVDLNFYKNIYLTTLFDHLDISIEPTFFSTIANQSFLPMYTQNYPVDYKQNNKSLKLIDLEFNIPIVLGYKNYEVKPIVHFNTPINAPNENLKSYFYFSFNLVYNFYLDKGQIKKLYAE